METNTSQKYGNIFRLAFWAAISGIIYLFVLVNGVIFHSDSFAILLSILIAGSFGNGSNGGWCMFIVLTILNFVSWAANCDYDGLLLLLIENN